jgi:hypothetical protein
MPFLKATRQFSHPESTDVAAWHEPCRRDSFLRKNSTATSKAAYRRRLGAHPACWRNRRGRGVKLVYAFADKRSMSDFSRWKPRLVTCTDDATHQSPGTDHVVKFRQGQTGTAALISEIVCGEILDRAGMSVPARRLVHADTDFCKNLSVTYSVTPGQHFGTVCVAPMHSGPPTRVDQLASPQELVNMWAFDTWFCNIDRDTVGNIGMCPAPHKDKFELMAIDQSDCFGGAAFFSSGNWPNALLGRGPARSASITINAIFEAGPTTAISTAAQRVDTAVTFIDSAIAQVPGDWWAASNVKPDDVSRFLRNRAPRVFDLLNADGRFATDNFEGALILTPNGGQ